jgi:hypothetical protein
VIKVSFFIGASRLFGIFMIWQLPCLPVSVFTCFRHYSLLVAHHNIVDVLTS